MAEAKNRKRQKVKETKAFSGENRTLTNWQMSQICHNNECTGINNRQNIIKTAIYLFPYCTISDIKKSGTFFLAGTCFRRL
jgi:hypothetical protein